MTRVFPATIQALLRDAAKTGLVVLALAGIGVPALLNATPVMAQDQEFTEEHLRLGARLGEITGANQLYVNALNAQRRDIIRALTSTNPDIGPTITEVVDQVYVDMAGTTTNLFTAIATIYASAYVEEDLAQIVTFFESDVGQRYVANQRATDQAVLQVTVNWGDQVSVAFLDRVRTLLVERGIEM
jgi:hypothetical protein